MKLSFKTVLALGLTIAFSVSFTLAVTNPKLLMGYFGGATVVTEDGQVNSNNVTNTNIDAGTTTTINNTINLTSDGFAIPGAPIVLYNKAQEDTSDTATLSEKEEKKIGRGTNLYKGDGESFVNGSFTLGANSFEEIDGIDFANVSVYQLSPSSFKVKAGWTQDFITRYGTYRLAVEKVTSGHLKAAAYKID